jgi:hypothetical protein
MDDIEIKPKKIPIEELGDEGCHALSFCQALFILQKHPSKRTLADAEFIRDYAQVVDFYKTQLTDSEIEDRKRRGIKRLADLGVIEVTRNGMGELEPLVIHEDKLDRKRRMITGNFQ